MPKNNNVYHDKINVAERIFIMAPSLMVPEAFVMWVAQFSKKDIADGNLLWMITKVLLGASKTTMKALCSTPLMITVAIKDSNTTMSLSKMSPLTDMVSAPSSRNNKG